LKLDLEKSINSFWRMFIELENQLIEILHWIKVTVNSTIIKLNKNRDFFFFHIIKDYVNFFFKDYLTIKYFFQKLYITTVFNNIQLVFQNSLLNSNDLSLQFAFNKLKNTVVNYDFSVLLLNKLNLNHETSLNVEKTPAVFVSKNEKEINWVDVKFNALWI
jgi:hypothetical protein